MSRFTIGTIRPLAIALLLGTSILAIAPLTALAAAPVTEVATTPAQSAISQRSHERSEARIASMHQRLHLTVAQEPLWTNVAQTMRDNDATFHTAMPAGTEAKTAIDDLKTFQIMADEHAAGLKKLIPVFEKLYADLTLDQKKYADRLFGRHQRRAERD